MDKQLFLNGTDNFLKVPRWVCVREGETVEITEKEITVVCRNGKAQLLPTYAACEKVNVGNLRLEFVVKEITEAEEYTAYQILTQYHYRSHSLVGRRARLVVRNYHPLYPKIIGYIELTTPFFMNKARSRFLDAPFRMNGTSWEAWDVEARRSYTNLIIRIARCVVYPEFRGLGLGQILVKHAANYARLHWQVGGLKPYFLEISADMLKFVPFAQKAGMVFIGETEGNLARAARDMGYLLRNRNKNAKYNSLDGKPCGFLDQQMARAHKAADLLEREQWSIEELILRLHSLKKNITLKDHLLFRGIVSFPKPTYLGGLNAKAEKFIADRTSLLNLQNGHQPITIALDPLSSAIELKNLSLTYASKVRRTKQTQAIQTAFDISPENINHVVIHNLSLNVTAGQIILLTGASGSGKSTLLNLFAQRKLNVTSGKIHFPNNYSPSSFEPIRSDKALIELIAPQDVRTALNLLGIVGLSDALVYLKRFRELSHGQQYRVMLARLIASGSNFWLADEFCSALDPLTANLVADRLQKVARRTRATLLVASSQPENFIAALRPDIVIQLTTAWEHRVVTGEEFMSSLPNRATSYEAPSLPIAAEYLSAVRAGRKTTTIRRGRRNVSIGLILLKSKSEVESVRVTEIKYKTFAQLTEGDAQRDGFQNLSELQVALRKFYPDLCQTSVVTIIYFQRMCKFHEP